MEEKQRLGKINGYPVLSLIKSNPSVHIRRKCNYSWTYIDEGVPCWKDSVMQDIFIIEEVHIIKSIPLSMIGREDQQVWHFSKNGIFFCRKCISPS